MSKEFRIPFPALFPAQQQILSSRARFTVVAGGRDAGKTTAAIDALLVSDFGALNGFPVGLFLPDREAIVAAKRRIFPLIQPLLTGRLDRARVELVNGGSIGFYALEDETNELWDQLALVVADDCHKIERIADTWLHVLQPMLARHRGRAWLFGKPQGVRNGFAKLYALQESDSRYRSFQLPTDANPYFDRTELERDRASMPPEVFLQERGAEFVDTPIELSAAQTLIGRDETFRMWCQRLAADGLKVDGHPFSVDDRPAMWFIYDQIPSTIEDAHEKSVVLMKCAQVGFTVMEILGMIYLSLKFMPVTVGMFLPDMKLAGVKSTERFMPILRTIPDAYKLMVDPESKGRGGEGNVMIRNLGGSKFFFLWTSGKGATESVPMDILALDEVQEMQVADMEKVAERLSASRVKFTLAGSTANWPDRDIHFLYKRGTRHQFHSRCPACGAGNVLDEYFPECIKFDPVVGDYRYVCKPCGAFLDDPQDGEWIAQDPEARHVSIHFPQFLSPTISARNIIEAYYNADDMKNFYNRKLGKPYVDPSQVPVNLEMLNNCAKEGIRLGVKWEQRGDGYFMGIDQMGAFNVALVAKRLASGHMAIVHAEEIYDLDPFARCDELMRDYRIAVCCVETLPNYNDAKRFANRHPGKVFLAGYADMRDDMLRWGDAVPTKSERKTDEEERDRYTVTLDQYKCMQVAMARVQKMTTVFPNPEGLLQEITEKGGIRGEKRLAPILKDHVFLHFTRTALIAEKDEEQNKYRRRVVKVGIDPHFSYAYMLLNVAWARAHGTTAFLLPDAANEPAQVGMPGSVTVNPVIHMMRHQSAIFGVNTCGTCLAYEFGSCTLRFLHVKENDAACDLFAAS
ncbi:MAG TPA: phage terminase large subunit family protein [Burkholderiaceae bacterium]